MPGGFWYYEDMIVGIDEVGRGPWAGPLVVGAVILGCEIDGVTDSKKLSLKKRTELDKAIRKKAKAVALGWVYPDEIDTLGLAPALELACKKALQEIDALGVAYHEIIIDGTVNLLKNTPKGRFVTTMKKADLLVPSVGAASIVAKVARDTYMKEQAKLYPEYGFGTHVGYGTAAHVAAIEKHGVTPLHRLSFAPLVKYRIAEKTVQKQVQSRRHILSGITSGSAKLAALRQSSSREVTPDKINGTSRNVSEQPTQLSTKSIGDQAETTATSYLESLGHIILDRNWRTKFCEIDIVSQKGDTIYFVEVKHRKNDKAGDGLAMITKKKLSQMQFAAKLYASNDRAQSLNLQLVAIATTGQPPEVTDYIEIV